MHCVALQVLRTSRRALRRWRTVSRGVGGRGRGVEGSVIWERVGSRGVGVEALCEAVAMEAKWKIEEWFVG